MRVRFTVEALAHIAAFHSYIGAKSPRAAEHVVKRIFAEADRLGEFPRLGHQGQVPGTLELAVRRLPYIIVHELGRNGQVIVLGVYHGAQDR